jgi:hypothetical protein
VEEGETQVTVQVEDRQGVLGTMEVVVLLVEALAVARQEEQAEVMAVVLLVEALAVVLLGALEEAIVEVLLVAGPEVVPPVETLDKEGLLGEILRVLSPLTSTST